MVRIISIRYEDGYVLSKLINSLEIETIVCKFPMEEFDEHRVIFPDCQKEFGEQIKLIIMTKKNKELYIFNSDSLLELAKIEGSEWLEKQKYEFGTMTPNYDSFAFALNRYNETKHYIPENLCVAKIKGNNKIYFVYANGVIEC